MLSGDCPVLRAGICAIRFSVSNVARPQREQKMLIYSASCWWMCFQRRTRMLGYSRPDTFDAPDLDCLFHQNIIGLKWRPLETGLLVA